MPRTTVLGRDHGFQLPQDGETYIGEIVERCRALVTCRIWSDLHSGRLNTWLNNFDTPEERYFAACLLDSLIYRSAEQTYALIEHLLQRSLVDTIRLNPSPEGLIDDFLKLLQNSTDPGIRLVPVSPPDQPTMKSGPLVARIFRRKFDVNNRWFIPPAKIRLYRKKGIRVFIFVDDFLGTGDQFLKTVKAYNLEKELSSDSYFIYAPLVAHARGESAVRKKFNSLHISSVERLDDSYDVFRQGSTCFSDGINSPKRARRFYYEFLKRKRIVRRERDRCGYKGLGLLYAFEHSTPNATLPILWFPKKTGWAPLFDR